MHIEQLKKEVVPAIGNVNKFKNKFKMDTKLLLYNALVQSHFKYMAIIYAHKITVSLNSLQRTQIIFFFNLPRLYSTVDLYRNMSNNIQPVYGMYKYQILTYIYKAIHNFGPRSIQFNIHQNAIIPRNN